MSLKSWIDRSPVTSRSNRMRPEVLPIITWLVLALASDVIHGALKEFDVTWYDGREHVLRYNRTDYGDCLFTRSPDILKCMRRYQYKTITDIWRYDPEVIHYVSVRCQQQQYFAQHRHVCMCKNGTRAANPSSSRQYDEFYFCQVTKLSANTFKDLVNMETLDLSDNSIVSIEGETLKGITALRFLDLGRNPVRDLPGGLLCDVPRLEVLTMENTRLNAFPAHVFDCGTQFSNLTYIDLSEGEIASMVPDSLKNIQSLKSLNLSSNSLSNIPARTFLNAKNLEYLDLSRNDFVTFPEGICEPTEYLKHVRLNENHFGILNMTNFQECTNVTYLDISFNQIRKIFGNINTTMSVNHLNLSHNFIQDLGDRFLGSLAKLAVLDLAKNEIKRISPNAFRGLPSLTSLNVSSNGISNMSLLKVTFQPMENLTSLYLTDNSLHSLSDGLFEPLVKLQNLDLSRNLLNTLESHSFKGLVSLTNLSLSKNRITNLPSDIFQSLRVLKYVDLSFNLLVQFDDIVLPSVTLYLNLSHNILETFPNSVGRTNVVTFDLNANSISRLSRVPMLFLESVKFLDLSMNKLSEIENGAFKGLDNVEILNLSFNQLGVNLSLDIFKGASKIIHLDLSHNNVTNVDFMFSYGTLDNVESLTLANNPIYGVTDMMNKLANMPSPALRSLDLSRCRIRNVSVVAFKGFLNLGSVDLSENRIEVFDPLETKVGAQFSLLSNPLVCSCVMAWLAESYVVVDGNRLSTHDYKVDMCQIYPKGFNVSLRNVNKNDFLCRTEVGCDSSCQCFSRDRNGPITTVVCTDGLTGPPSLIPTSTIYLHLDGNNFPELTVDLSGGRSMLVAELYLNLSGIREIGVNVLSRYKSLVRLDLSHNRITDILPLTFQHQIKLTYLNMSHNFLTTLTTDYFKGLEELRSLDLTYNEFQIFDSISLTELSRFQNAFWVLLGQNPYSCTCANSNFRHWLDVYSNRVQDRREVKCERDGREIKSVSRERFKCLGMDNTSKPGGDSGLIIAAVVTVVVVASLGAAMFYYKRDLMAVLYTKLHIGCLRPPADKTKHHDAFVVYDTNNTPCSEWVRLMFMNKLERKRNYRFIFPDRARLLQSVADVESDQLYDCKCAVFVVSSSFMNNNWTTECFRKAWFYSLENNKFRVILVIFGDIDFGAVVPEMMQCLRKGNYITARSRSVWDRLIYELPDPHVNAGIRHDDDVSESDVILYNARAYHTLDDSEVNI